MKKSFACTFVFAILALAVSADSLAYSLMSPTSGNIKTRGVNLAFGSSWISYCGGYIKKHTGVDVQASKGEKIYATYDGYVVAAQLDATWGGWVTIDHGPTHTFNLTSVYWHVIPSVSVNTWVLKGQQIGTVADLGLSTHLHFGLREAAYSNVSNAGALPQTNCDGYPAFQEYFVNPWSLNYENNPY